MSCVLEEKIKGDKNAVNGEGYAAPCDCVDN